MASEPSPGPLKELASSRARFLAELGERIATVRQALARVGAGTEVGTELNAVRRRLHALAAAAEVLHFTAVADALGSAQSELLAVAGAASPGPARDRVSRILDLLPSLALGAAIDVAEEIEGERSRGPRQPLCVLVFGEASLLAALHHPGPLHAAETHATAELDQLLALVTRLGPDVVLLDGNEPELAEVVPRLRQAGGAGPLGLVAVGDFESHERMLRLVRRGVDRVLPSPVDPLALQRTVRQLVPREVPALARPHAFERVAPGGLIEAISAEARRAFVHSGSNVAPSASLSSAASHPALAALWGGFARIRALAIPAGDDAASLLLEGPYGAIPLAPSLADGSQPKDAAGTRTAEMFAGRRFVVADADATILGALSRALQRLGASVMPARDGAHALDLLERQWPDGLISDALLPGMDGFELCRRIREDVALADLPVALICWKEHLLEHARRLSEQHGAEPRALDLESFSPLANGLAQRAALERRLGRHEAVHGRLDGLTPRLLLQLACSRTIGSRLSLRAGRLAADVDVFDGRPAHARLLEEGAVVAEGPAVLGPFLGMRVGRFSFEPISAPPPAHFSGDVMTVLAPAITRARRVRAWLLAAQPEAVGRVEVDARVAAHYLDEAPALQKALVARLLRGGYARPSLAPGDGGDASTLLPALLELGQRGGLLSLVDREGHDVLLADAAHAARPSSPPRVPALRVPVASPSKPAAMTLGDAVLQAVSLPQDEVPSARRTHPGLAPPSEPPSPRQHAPRTSTPPLPTPELAADRSSAATRAAAVSSAAALSRTPADVSTPEALDAPEARKAPAARSEPDDDDDDHDDSEFDPDAPRGAPGDDEDAAPPASVTARIRAVASPVLVTLGAAALAFAGMRVIMGGALERLGDASASAEPPLAALEPEPELPPPPSPAPSPAAAPSPAPDLDAGDDSSVPAQNTRDERDMLADRLRAPPDVEVSTEILDAPIRPKLRAGHGLLEVQTWEPQRIYVDGVFMGNYARRLIPLQSGTYRLRLLAGARDIERDVLVEAGRRTLVSARDKSRR